MLSLLESFPVRCSNGESGPAVTANSKEVESGTPSQHSRAATTAPGRRPWCPGATREQFLPDLGMGLFKLNFEDFIVRDTI